MIDTAALLGSLPAGLRDPLIEEFRGLTTAHSEGRWKLSALDAGRFCEVVFTVLDGALSGAFASAPAKPAQFVQACRALECRAPITTGDRSIRILIPRVLPAMYDMRNNRNVGHVGGDVVANKMDATYLRDAATWVMAELVRIFHAVPVHEAQESVDALVERGQPLIWEHEGIRRVLDPRMRTKDKVLLLLHSSSAGNSIDELRVWVKYEDPRFAKRVIGELADALMVEVTKSGTHALITPLGIRYVEEKLLASR